jgi:signal transduction histidine kinase
VASAVLVLLAGSFAMSLLTARRARHMARQQVDFVAGVTHELKTPLAAIRSAGENLADGIVSEDPQVREYGVLVDRESRRLDEMVTELLELAGLQGRRRDPVLAPVAVSEIVDGALDDCRWTLDESGVEVEVDLARDLPAVLGERSSLRRAVHNLIHNAAIYGRAGGWVGVTAIAQPRSGRQGVAITVRDRGPGIARAEQSRVFEPFVRGREAGAVRASGSGLGLAVVHHVAEQHTGRVELDSDRSGTAVTLWLPAMPPVGAAGAGGDEP